MPLASLTMGYKRMAFCAAFALCTISLPARAASVNVDGNLADLESIPGYIGWNFTSAVSFYRGTDPLGNADSPASESGNGFDISQVFAYYDLNDDTFYFGMRFHGTVGDSQPFGSSAAYEIPYPPLPGDTSAARNAFDSNETYGLQIYLGSSTTDPQLLQYSVKGANNTTDTAIIGYMAPGLTVTHAVSEAFNGVEFGVTGLRLNGVAPEPHPNTFTIRFSAGSADVGGATSMAAEDFHLVTMSAIPIPPAIWLFGSGLAGLIAMARRRRREK